MNVDPRVLELSDIIFRTWTNLYFGTLSFTKELCLICGKRTYMDCICEICLKVRLLKVLPEFIKRKSKTISLLFSLILERSVKKDHVIRALEEHLTTKILHIIDPERPIEEEIENNPNNTLDNNNYQAKKSSLIEETINLFLTERESIALAQAQSISLLKEDEKPPSKENEELDMEQALIRSNYEKFKSTKEEEEEEYHLIDYMDLIGSSEEEGSEVEDSE